MGRLGEGQWRTWGIAEAMGGALLRRIGIARENWPEAILDQQGVGPGKGAMGPGEREPKITHPKFLFLMNHPKLSPEIPLAFSHAHIVPPISLNYQISTKVKFYFCK